MTYEQVVAKVKAKFADADASAIDGVVALQINLEGKNTNGIFYIEVKDHNVNVEPYEYYDRHAIVTVNPTNLMKLVDGKLDPIEAYNKGKVTVEGTVGAIVGSGIGAFIGALGWRGLRKKGEPFNPFKSSSYTLGWQNPLQNPFTEENFSSKDGFCIFATS